MHKKTIVVDFDGVINQYNEPYIAPDFIPDRPVVGALDFIKRVLENPNYDLKIFSSRNAQEGGIKAMQIWLKYWFIKEYGWAIGAGIGNQLAKHSTLLPVDHPNYWDYFPLHKEAGWINIDDRVYLFKGIFPTFEEIDNFKPWNHDTKSKMEP